MTTGNQTINFFQVGMIFMLMNGLLTHVIINPMLLDAAGRDAWISVILSGVLVMPWCWLLVLFMRKSQQKRFYPWLAGHSGKIIAWLIILPLCIQLYFIGAETVIHTDMFTIANYMPELNGFLIAVTLVTVAYFFARSGLKMIAIASGILLPIVIALGYLVSFGNMPHKEFNLLLPMFENGFGPALTGMIYAGAGYVELIMLFAIQHHIRGKVKYWHIALLAFIIIYITIGPIIGAITEFGATEAAKQLESPFEQWRLVKLGNDIEHVDFLSLYQWLAGAIIRASFSIYLLTELLPLKTVKTRHIVVLLICLSYLALSLFTFERFPFYKMMYDFYMPVTLVVCMTLSFICVVIALLASKKKEKKKKEDSAL